MKLRGALATATFAAILLPPSQAMAQVNLIPGDVAIVAWTESASPDPFYVVALKPLDSGTILYFTNNGWTGTKFQGVTASDANGFEELCKLTLNQAVAAGTVIKAYNNNAAWTWTTSGAIGAGGSYSKIDLSSAPGDQIYVVQSTSTSNPLFTGAVALFVLDSTNGFEDAISGVTGGVPPGLSITSNTAISVSLVGPSKIYFDLAALTVGTKAQWLEAMSDDANWYVGDMPARPASIVVNPDADLDGVIDADDVCPDTPLNEFAGSSGCSCSQTLGCAQVPDPCVAAKSTQSVQREDGYLGIAVAVRGNRAAVGSLRENPIGEPAEHGGVRVYERTTGNGATGGWALKATLVESGFAEGFGSAIAIEDDALLVGRPSGVTPGVTFFKRESGTWSFKQLFSSNDADFNDEVGASLAIDGDTLIVGAPGQDSASLNNRGAAYVFTRSGSTWSQQKKLTASDDQSYAKFGSSVAFHGDTAIIGAIGADGAEVETGAAYVFVRSGNNWTEQQKLIDVNGQPLDGFGCAVGLTVDSDGDVWAIVGASGTGSGEAFFYRRSGTTWTLMQTTSLVPALILANGFGSAISADGDRAMIGAPNTIGTAALFVRVGDEWYGTLMNSPDGADDDQFGGSVAISGNTIVVGAPDHDLTKLDTGAAYFLDAADCNGNGISDACDIAAAVSADVNGDGKPDECQQCGVGNVTFSLDLSEWQAAAGDVVSFDTTAANIALCEEVAAPPGSNAQLGGTLTFLTTPLAQQFSVKCLEPSAGFTFTDTEGSSNYINALSVGDINNFEDDDWSFEFLSGPPVYAFGLDVRENILEVGESFTIYCEGGGIQTVTFEAPNVSQGFFGVVSDIPIKKIVFNEDPGGDDIAIANFKWSAPPPPACPADLNGDDIVDGADLATLLGSWGTSGAGDVDGSGSVDGADLATVLGAWGACP